MGLAATISVDINGSNVVTPGTSDSSRGTDTLSVNTLIELADGTGDNQANIQVCKTGSLAPSTPLDLDISGSAMTDALNRNVVLTKVRAIAIYNTATTTGYNLSVGGAASNQWSTWAGGTSHKVVIPPGGMMLLAAPKDGYAVTAGTGDILRLDPGSNTVGYRVVIFGTI